MATPGDFLILVVDDEPDIRTYLQTVLEDAGFRVNVACDGREALESVKQERPDFISLDMVMPRGTGIGFLHELRRRREWVNIPVMILTGHARDDLGRADLERALEGKLLSGPGAYLEKPVTPAKYIAAVSEALGIVSESAPEPVPDAASARTAIDEALKNASPETMREILRLLGKS